MFSPTNINSFLAVHLQLCPKIITFFGMLSVRPSDRILFIKTKIAEQLPLSIGDINLSKEDILLLDDYTLSECHIDNHSIKKLNKGYPISLTIKLLSGIQEIEQYNINTYTDYTVPELKNEIFNIVRNPADH